MTDAPGPCGCQLIVENVRLRRRILGPTVRVGDVLVRTIWCETHRAAPETSARLRDVEALNIEMIALLRAPDSWENCVKNALAAVERVRALDASEQREKRTPEMHHPRGMRHG